MGIGIGDGVGTSLLITIDFSGWLEYGVLSLKKAYD
jgi:hypothetical protein